MRYGLLPVVCLATGSASIGYKSIVASGIMHKIFAKLHYREYNKR